MKHGGGALNPKIDVGLSANPLAVKSVRAELGHLNNDYEFTFESEVLAPWDPDVEIEVLEPGTSRDLLLETALEVLELEDLPYNRSDQYLTPALKHIDSFLGCSASTTSAGSVNYRIASPKSLLYESGCLN